VTVRGFLLPDEITPGPFTDEELVEFEHHFLRNARHEDCGVCHGTTWVQRAFVWPRNGFSEFPLDFKPALASVVQSV
jgi:hypothetical protein